MLPELHAERQLLEIEAASVPHMEKEARSGVISRWTRRLRGSQEQKKVGLVEALMQAGIPIKQTPKKKPSRGTGRAGTTRRGTREREPR